MLGEGVALGVHVEVEDEVDVDVEVGDVAELGKASTDVNTSRNPDRDTLLSVENDKTTAMSGAAENRGSGSPAELRLPVSRVVAPQPKSTNMTSKPFSVCSEQGPGTRAVREVPACTARARQQHGLAEVSRLLTSNSVKVSWR